MIFNYCTRDEARQKNLKHFFTGIPCKNGHVTGRLVSSGDCLSCAAIARKKSKEKAKGVPVARSARLSSPPGPSAEQVARENARIKKLNREVTQDLNEYLKKAFGIEFTLPVL